MVLSGGEKGNWFSLNWGWGLAVTLGVLVSGGVSGGHINPAVTIALAAIGKFSWIKVLPYMLAQYVGAILASATVFGVYYEALVDFEKRAGNADGDYFLTPQTAGIWATYPAEYLSHQGGLADQIVGTGLLLLCICAITDARNMSVPKSLVPLYVGFVVLNIGVCFGYNCGYAINPARDLGPR
jgi:MIP family channel proteins